jgi:hypothetical protein
MKKMKRLINNRLKSLSMQQAYKILTIFISLFLFVLLMKPVLAQNTATLSLTATVEKRTKIEINTGFISFTRASSIGEPQRIPASEGSFELTVKMASNYNSTVNIWLLASYDLTDSSTGYTIPIETISWEANGSGFYSGQLSKSAPALVARRLGPGTLRGTLDFIFAEDPNFAPGSYQATVTILVEGV